MTELSLLIQLYSIADKKRYPLQAHDYFRLSALSVQSVPGSLIDCSQDIIIDLPDKIILNKFNFPRSCIVYFESECGKKIQIGTIDIPAQVAVVPDLNVAHLIISCKMLKSPYL